MDFYKCLNMLLKKWHINKAKSHNIIYKRAAPALRAGGITLQ
jgi:hypothetical protein